MCKGDKVCMYRKEGAGRRSADEELKKEKEKRWTGEDWLEGRRKQEEMGDARMDASPLYIYLPIVVPSGTRGVTQDRYLTMHARMSLSLSSDGPP
jgi:hypothetical protein